MADQSGELRQINWEECFPFTRLFKGFRMAMQPTKLALALAGILLMALWGGVLDCLWSGSATRPVNGETWAFWQTPDIGVWRDAQLQARRSALQTVYGPGGLLNGRKAPAADEMKWPAAVKQALADLKSQYYAEAGGLKDPAAVAAQANRYAAEYERLSGVRGRGIFYSFLEYEREVIANLLTNGRRALLLDWAAVARNTDDVLIGRRGLAEIRPVRDIGDIGMLGSVILMYRGVQWMWVTHWFYAALFLLGSLAIWSLFGGAICRMSALNVARDEQIPPKAALQFALRKFFGFFTAPLLPVLMILIIGVALFLGGFLLLSIPVLGDVLGTLLLVLALLGGFIMALIAVGVFGGGGLLWPTIAVEGSDGFDAVSRSYSYFYSRPWRLAFYSIVATIYGGVTYLGLQYFVYVLLRLTRGFVGLGTAVWTDRPGTGIPGASKLEAMWPLPSPDNLMGDGGPMLGLASKAEALGAGLIWLWVLLIVLVLCAYLVSFYFSVSTVIYYLLRNRVDATDMEDVFIEEEDEPALAAGAALAGQTGAASGGASAETASPPGEQPTA